MITIKVKYRGVPASGATVRVGSVSMKTDHDGIAKVNVIGGKHILTISFAGQKFGSDVQKVDLMDGAEIEHHFDEQWVEKQKQAEQGE